MNKKIQHTVREYIILSLTLLGFSKRLRSKKEKDGPLVRILVLHDVQDAQWFRELIDTLHNAYHFISPDDFVQKNFSDEKINVLLTFDDGYRSWTRNCLDVLARYDVQALFFVNSELLNLKDRETERVEYVTQKLMLGSRETLSWNDVKEIARAHHEIGGHTKNHVDLTALNGEDLQTEIARDKAEIENNLGTPPRFFAYPFGTERHFNRDVVAALNEHYRYAFTTVPGFVSLEGNLLTVPRLCLEENQSMRSLKRWVEGGYDVFYSLKRILRKG